MNYQQYFPLDVVNGPGSRATLFVSGCEHQCRGCYNQSTWSPDSGHEFDDQMVQQIIKDLNDTRIKRRGLSLTGGDPLFPQNVDAILALVKRVKAECPDKDIWLWTGYQKAELTDAQSQVLEYIDVLVDGKFEQSQADPSLQFRGSRNQVIHQLHQ
ncbi:anaerobic ribonucleoside-triphosphate reductase-activating protein [Shewanella sp. Isolate11]|uniref:anaerobic ribonucleoside-triphosphate reductase-activating protein n=1 Tax=Shewanella sp. Isolate11 TaxID=2908530 RepID=UPI001EFD84A6|nr:anaerobic ribonucleoside-triphosphate reductase-activating protein [Shewanella sp. Isolate11]MCG9696275.1 anaerobic ribonucleoside-triphosphate reductase-activating protein [Shewanella sp. Isolate11]